MKLAELAQLKPGSQLPPESLEAETELFDLDLKEVEAWPDSVVIVDGEKRSAVISKNTALLIRGFAPEYMVEVLENCPAGIVAIDEDSRIIFANKAYTSILGIPRQRVLGRLMRELEPEADILSVLASGSPLVNHLSHIKSVDRYVRVNIFSLRRGNKEGGAVSFFTDVTEAARLTEALDRANTIADQLRRELDDHRELPSGFGDIIGRNPDLLKTLKTAGTAAVTDVPLLILGEHGVGKEVLARAVHAASSRRQRAFITVNCAAIPETLFESELFGYEDGSFTGARRGGALGKFELADGGTIFLDEIGDMPLAMQAKMLRALQEGEVEKIGRRAPVPVDVRVLAATNQDLEKMVDSGRFRADLYYRLNMVTVVIPPLRRRADDVALLAEDILNKCRKKYGKNLRISPRLLNILQTHTWPGNVRELANCLEYAVIMCSGPLIEPVHLPAQFLDKPEQEAKIDLPLKGWENSRPEDGIDNPLKAGELKKWKEAIKQTELQLLTEALAVCGGNRSEAIRRLGLSRKAFYAKLKEYDLL